MHSSSFLARSAPLVAAIFLAGVLYSNPVSAAPRKYHSLIVTVGVFQWFLEHHHFGKSPSEKLRLSLDTALVQKRYAAGWCGVHVTQHQKNEPDNPSGNYKLDIQIKDAGGAQIGGVGGADAPTNQGVGVTSQLPAVLIVTTGAVDDDSVLFDYNGAHWGSNDQAHCSFGRYDSGKREGDCGFTC